ncbi:tumor necrosis factor receptor superfamily member 10B-like [Arvicanthis niloticus]|uniref:tumor necrosis factor receptor superfamily member 10B-like n=1 Tax=Arvicanthis niloticus TaxID=61156 RepID=UPI001485DBE3|nr:tumor necrosis factor receptor superfamily member 10B-like [Arvicanthis niloticus]
MKPPGPSRGTSPPAWADHTPGLRPLLKLRLRTSFALRAILLLGVFVSVTAKPVHGLPADPQRLEQSPSEGLCPAGYYLPEENGLCKPCKAGIDYTSFPNSLTSCLLCSVCKKDKVVKHRCTITRNTDCQCKPGTFEDKDSTEICQMCSNCTDGEDEVTPCTPETNRICVSQNTRTSQHNLGLEIGLPVTVLVLLIVVALFAWKTGAWRWVSPFMKRAYPGHEQDPESMDTMCSSLLDPQTLRKTNDSHHNTKPDKTRSSPTGRKLLVPANGNDPDAALKLIFDYCSNEVPYNSWDRLVRQLGLTDNQIQVIRAETPVPREALYQMLLKWLHQTGLSASINHLLGALEAMGEKHAMEKIEHYAVKSRKFIYENITAQAGVVTQETEPGESL